MVAKSFFDQLKNKVDECLPKKLHVVKDDLKKVVTQQVQRAFSRMDLVSREEFNVQKRALNRAKEKLKEINQKLDEIEQKLNKKSK